MNCKTNILCFADAGAEVGSGHVFRVYPVFEALVRRKASVKMFVPLPPRKRPATILPRVQSAKVREFVAGIREAASGAVLLDSYRQRERIIAAAAKRPVVMFDDHYHLPDGLSLVINASPVAKQSRYAPSTPALLGPAYASLDRAFRLARRRFRVRTRMAKALVALGGSDTTGGLAAVSKTLIDSFGWLTLIVCGAPQAKVQEHPRILRRPWLGQDELAALMASCDFAVLAGGQMLVQAACIGLPALALPQTPNQSLHAASWQKIGSAVVVENLAGLPAACTQLAGKAKRARMSRAGRATVDGRGAERIAERLLKLLHARH